MSEDRLKAELLYQSTMKVALKAYKDGLMSKEDYKQIDTIFTQKYRPSLGSLFVDISLMDMGTYGNM